MHQIGLLLPVPESLAADLRNAKERNEGFLMKDQEKVGHPEYGATWEVDTEELAEKMKHQN